MSAGGGVWTVEREARALTVAGLRYAVLRDGALVGYCGVKHQAETMMALTAKAAALDALVEAVRCTLQAHVIDGIGGPVRRELNDALSAAKAAQVKS